MISVTTVVLIVVDISSHFDSPNNYEAPVYSVEDALPDGLAFAKCEEMQNAPQAPRARLKLLGSSVPYYKEQRNIDSLAKATQRAILFQSIEQLEPYAKVSVVELILASVLLVFVWVFLDVYEEKSCNNLLSSLKGLTLLALQCYINTAKFESSEYSSTVIDGPSYHDFLTNIMKASQAPSIQPVAMETSMSVPFSWC